MLELMGVLALWMLPQSFPRPVLYMGLKRKGWDSGKWYGPMSLSRAWLSRLAAWQVWCFFGAFGRHTF